MRALGRQFANDLASVTVFDGALAEQLDPARDRVLVIDDGSPDGTGKIAALFAQSVNDDVVIDGVNDIENLSSNLSRKIWQKITLIEERR